MPFNTPDQTAAIAVDYLLTVVNRVALMNAAEAKAFKKHLEQSALDPIRRDLLLTALGF